MNYRYKYRDKIVIRVGGLRLQFGDIAIINEVDYSRPSNDYYYCYCALREIGEWMNERYFDKFIEHPSNVKGPVYDKIKKAAAEKASDPIVRHKATYTNLPSPYGIADELKKEE